MTCHDDGYFNFVCCVWFVWRAARFCFLCVVRVARRDVAASRYFVFVYCVLFVWRAVTLRRACILFLFVACGSRGVPRRRGA